MTASSVLTPTVEPTEAEPASTYRPHLDGLRAVAVYLVVLFHAGSRFRRRLHRRRRVLRAVGLSRHPAAAARSRPQRVGSGSGASTRGDFAGCCPRRSSRSSSPRSCSPPSRRAGRGVRRGRIVQSRVPVLGELVFHPPRERLLRRRHLDQPGAAFLVAGGRRAVLPAVAAHARRRLPAQPPARPPPPDARDQDRGRASVRSRRPRGRCRCEPGTPTTRTTAPTPAPTSSSRARSSRSRPRRSPGRSGSADSCGSRPSRRSVRC